MTIRNYLTKLREWEETLIPSRYNDTEHYEYLQPYFENAQQFDTLYMLVSLPTLPLVSDDMGDLMHCIEATIAANRYKWEKLYKTTLLVYNPIWNVDGTEIEEHEIGERKITNNYDKSKSTGTSSQVPDDMAVEKEVAKNVSEMDAREDVVTEAEAYDKITRTRSGNIGVTKTQDMIRDEREIAAFNYIDVVVKDVINAITYPYFSED